MKYIILFLLIPVFGNSQKIVENKVDEFTKNSVVRTSWEPLTKSLGLSSTGIISYTQLNKINGAIHLSLRLTLKDGPFAVSDKAKFMLMAEDDSILTLLNSKYEISCRGCGTIGIAYSSMDGVELIFDLAESDISFLLSNRIKKIRIYTTKGYVEAEVKDKLSDAFSKQISIIY